MNYSKIRRDIRSGAPVAKKKSSIRKCLHFYHLLVVESTLRCQQSDSLLMLPPVSLTTTANLLPASATLGVMVENLPPVSLIPVVHLDLQISLRIFEKVLNDPNGIIRGWGEDDSR